MLRSNATTFSAFEIKRIFVRKQKLSRAFVRRIFRRHEPQVRQAQHAGDVRVIDSVVTAVAVHFEREYSAHVRVMHHTVLPHGAFNFASQI